jgi:REP element-mobilizing transposase RayT
MKIEYNNLYTHFIFTTHHKLPFITEENKERVENYISGIVYRQHCKMCAIYANPEHVHFLVSRTPDKDEEHLAEIIADSTINFINESNMCSANFQWQNSCTCFSVSQKDVTKVRDYILGQKKYHHKYVFNNEYEEYIKLNQQNKHLVKANE